MAAYLQHRIQEGLEFVLPGKCYDRVLIKFDFFNPECFSLALSRCLGLGITVASLFLFLPQILKIHLAKSGKGVSLSSQLLGFLGCFGVTAYSYANGFVFSQWGDSLFVAIQMVLVIMQILYFDSRSATAFAFFASCWSATLAVVYGYIPLSVLTLLQASTIPITAISKILQILATYKDGSTGQLSIVSVFLQFAGCFARIFTSVKETGDMLVIVSYIVATVLNGIVFSQFFIYWDVDKKKKRN